MAAKKILLLLDSDRNSFPLIEYMVANAKLFSWKLKLGTFETHIAERIKHEPYTREIEFVEFRKMAECESAIRKSDLVIALANDALMLQIADACISFKKTLVSPGRLTRQMALKKTSAKENNALILMDCGFSPGLDHIIAKKAIDNIHSRGGKITHFKTYSGTFIDESADPNPWNFKLTEPITEVLTWGKQNNRHLINNRMQHIPSHRLFERSEPIVILEHRDMMAVPEGDSLYYRKIYDLSHAHTVLKARLLTPDFDQLWKIMTRLGLTDSAARIDFGADGSYYNLLDSLLPPSATLSIEDRLREHTGAEREDVEKLKWLGLFDTTQWNDVNRELTPAQITQSLFEKKFSLQPDDRDCVVMEHHLGYELRDENFEMTATLVLRGENEKSSALARVTGFTCGAAAKSVLLGSIKSKGVHIPTVREIYDPILNELEEQGIAFHITDNTSQTAEVETASINR